MGESEFSLPLRSPIKVHKTVRGIEMAWNPLLASGLVRFFPAAFLMFWLCGWLAGEIMVVRLLVTQILTMPWFAKLFLCVWLIGWTIGGYFAIKVLRILIRPSKAERLIFEEDVLLHDPGFNPLSFWIQKDGFLSRRTRDGEMFEIRKADVTGVKLEIGRKGRYSLKIETKEGAAEIGVLLEQFDKKWLHQRLCEWWDGVELKND